MHMELTFPEQMAVWEKRMASPDFQLMEPDAHLATFIHAPQSPVYKALDVGCGWGRHLVHLAQLGWRVTGIDWSSTAVINSRMTLNETSLKGQVIRGDVRRMPFSDVEFQLVVAIDVLQHGRLVDFRRAMTEIKRVVRINSLVIISVPSVRNCPLHFPGTWIEDNTMIMNVGIEAGIPHHFFTEQEIRSATPMFHDVKVDSVVHDLPPGIEPLHAGYANEWLWIQLRG